jgi:hypothetical protein
LLDCLYIFSQEQIISFLLSLMQAMSFTCFNHVEGQSAASEGAAASKEGGGDGDGDSSGKAAAPTLETYAVKLKKADIPEFIDVVKKHMPKGTEEAV